MAGASTKASGSKMVAKKMVAAAKARAGLRCARRRRSGASRKPATPCATCEARRGRRARKAIVSPISPLSPIAPIDGRPEAAASHAPAKRPSSSTGRATTTTADVSPRKLLANRANARRSTGPRTREGKQRSRRNATTHGLFCQDVVLPGECERTFLAMRRQMIARLRPRDVVELLVVERFASAAWRLLRVREAEAWANAVEGLKELNQDELQAAHVAAFGPEREPDEKSTNAAMWGAYVKCREHLPAALMLLKQLSHPDRVHERLSKYEQRLEYTIHRCLGELATLQKKKEDDDERELPEWSYLNDAPPLSRQTEPEDERADDGANEEEEEHVDEHVDEHVAQPPPAVVPSDRNASSSEDAAEGGGATTDLSAQNEPTAASERLRSVDDATNGAASDSAAADGGFADDSSRTPRAKLRAPAD